MTEVPLPAQGVQEGDPGHISDHHAIANFLQQAAQAGELGTSAAYMPYNIRTYGAIGNGIADDKAAILAAFQAAETNGGRKIIYAPTGTYAISGSLSLSGFSSVLRGDGCQNSAAAGGGTTFKAIAQTGPVLNFTGFKWPDYAGRATISGFNVVGDGTSDPTQVKAGISLVSAMNSSFTDITISGCGGPPLKIAGASYCDFTRLLLTNPLGAKANDVAWIQAGSILGCRFSDLLLHSLLSTADVGVSGVLRVAEASGGLSSAGNVFTDLLFDTLHLPSNACVVSHKGNTSILENFTFSGCVKENSSATATAYVRFDPASTDQGGNTLLGVIPGKGTGTTDIDVGVDITQSRNTVRGVKGFRGANVALESGVGFTTVMLSGSTGAATDIGIVDNSGQLTNTLHDAYLGMLQSLNYELLPKPASAGGAGVQVSDSSNAQLGAVYLGNQGAAVQNGASQQKSLYYTGDRHYFRDSTKALLPLTLSGISGEPSALVVASGASPVALRSSGNIDFATDNTFDVGTNSAGRPRDLYVGRNLSATGTLGIGGSATIAGQASVGSLLIGGTAPPSITCGVVGGITTTPAGRYTWTNPLGVVPSGTILTTGVTGGSPSTTFIPHLLLVSASTIIIYFTTGAGAQASSTTGVSFRFELVK
jgi:hypothetical protein